MDLEPYAQAWRERFRAAEEGRRRRAQAARSRLPGLVDYLASEWHVRRIWLFGSLVEDAFDEASDIDLAVEGLPPGAALFRAGAGVEELARPFRVDLVPMEDAREAVRRKVLVSGELLYAATS